MEDFSINKMNEKYVKGILTAKNNQKLKFNFTGNGGSSVAFSNSEKLKDVCHSCKEDFPKVQNPYKRKKAAKFDD